MATPNGVEPPKASVENSFSAETIRGLDEKCRACRPPSVLDCVSKCRTWRLKNELLQLNKKMKDPDFTERLLNTLKNKRRLQILEAIARGRLPAEALQQELKRLGFTHSQGTIEEEYIQPLMQADLAAEEYGKYYATAFGCRVSELAGGFGDVEDVLPSHSECYEETLLTALLSKPRVYEDFRVLVPEKSVARVLSRLQKAGLVETSKDKEYVFFFRTQRDPAKEKLSPTGRRTYEGIPEEGVSARKLTRTMGISLRRTYKYLRRLKGKKLVFIREKPRTYTLTARGTRIAMVVRSICDIVSETMATARQLEEDQKIDAVKTVSASQASGTQNTSVELPPAQVAG